MKKLIMQKWVKALRSGKYKQTKQMLKDKNGYCCLGVLCAISPWKNNYTKIAKKNDEQLLFKEIQNLAGIKTSTGVYIKNSLYYINCSLAAMNDNGFSFNEISNVIEKNWKKL